MKVTDIRKGEKSLRDIYIDGEYAVSLYSATVAEESVHVGTELDDDLLYELIRKSDLRRAKERALNLLSYRDHSRMELVDKLKKDFSEETAEYTADRMEELGILNDERLAARYAKELLLVKRLSARAAFYKMLQKGFDRELSEAVLEDVNVDPREQIAELLGKKYYRQLSDEKGIKKTIAALRRSGYGYADIRAAIDEFTEDWTETHEF